MPGNLSMGDDVTNAGFYDMRTECPKCGEWARYFEGIFDVRDGVVEVLTAPEWTHQRLRDLQASVQSALRTWPIAGPNQAIRELATASPELATLLEGRARSGWSRGDMLALLSFIASLIFGVLSLLPEDDQTVQVDPRQLRQIVEQLDRPASPHGSQGTTPGSPGPRTDEPLDPPVPPPAEP